MYRREERLRYCSYVLVSRDLHHCMALNTLCASFKPVSDTLRHFYLCVFDQQMECSLDILRNKTYDERVDSEMWLRQLTWLRWERWSEFEGCRLRWVEHHNKVRWKHTHATLASTLPPALLYLNERHTVMRTAILNMVLIGSGLASSLAFTTHNLLVRKITIWMYRWTSSWSTWCYVVTEAYRHYSANATTHLDT